MRATANRRIIIRLAITTKGVTPIIISPVYNSKYQSTVTASDATLKSAVVIKAEYNNNIMSNVQIYPVSSTDKQALIEKIEINENEKVYVWNSIDGENSMKPLSDVFSK